MRCPVCNFAFRPTVLSVKVTMKKRIQIIALNIMLIILMMPVFSGCGTRNNAAEVFYSENRAKQNTYESFTQNGRDPVAVFPLTSEGLIGRYQCPTDNMFGLADVLIYEDRIVTVFEKDAFDSPQLENIDYYVSHPEKSYGGGGYIRDNLSKYRANSAMSTVICGEYRICSVSTEYPEYEAADPEKPTPVIGVGIMRRHIYFSDGNLELHYIADFVDDATEIHTQKYYSSKGQWGSEEIESIPEHRTE